VGLTVPSVWLPTSQLVSVLCTAVCDQPENGSVATAFPIGYSNTKLLYGPMKRVVTRLSYAAHCQRNKTYQPEEKCRTSVTNSFYNFVQPAEVSDTASRSRQYLCSRSSLWNTTSTCHILSSLSILKPMIWNFYVTHE
jgi:hypothetical protein